MYVFDVYVEVYVCVTFVSIKLCLFVVFAYVNV